MNNDDSAVAMMKTYMSRTDKPILFLFLGASFISFFFPSYLLQRRKRKRRKLVSPQMVI